MHIGVLFKSIVIFVNCCGQSPLLLANSWKCSVLKPKERGTLSGITPPPVNPQIVL